MNLTPRYFASPLSMPLRDILPGPLSQFHFHICPTPLLIFLPLYFLGQHPLPLTKIMHLTTPITADCVLEDAFEDLKDLWTDYLELAEIPHTSELPLAAHLCNFADWLHIQAHLVNDAAQCCYDLSQTDEWCSTKQYAEEVMAALGPKVVHMGHAYFLVYQVLYNGSYTHLATTTDKLATATEEYYHKHNYVS